MKISLYEAARNMVDELDMNDVPQMDEDGNFGESTCLYQLQVAMHRYSDQISAEAEKYIATWITEEKQRGNPEGMTIVQMVHNAVEAYNGGAR